MAEETILRLTLAVILATLAAMVYSLRVIILMDRRIAKIEMHIDRMVHKTLQEEYKIERAIKRRFAKKKTKKKKKRR